MTRQKTVRVLQIIDTLSMGGAETWLMELLRLWSGHGHFQMDFLLTSGKRGIFDEEARKLGAHLYYVPFGRKDLLSFAREFRRILNHRQYHAIHDHQDYASGWHFLFGLGVLPKVRITHVHNPWLHISTNYETSFLRRATVFVGKRLVRLLATDVCGTSEQILRQYGFRVAATSVPAVSVVHCGIDVQKFSAPRLRDRQSVLSEFGWRTHTKIVLFAGRLDRALQFDHPQNHKNSWFALNVVRAALKRNSNIRFLMAGAPDHSREALEAHIECWGLQEQLRLLGVRSDLPRLMRAADVLLFPSRQEGLGMVAVEAQAAGLHVVASTAVPQECVVISDLYHALSLTEPLEKWSDVLLKTLSKPRLSHKVCGQAIQMSAFSIVESANRLGEIYGGHS
jgi:glycosyltransferase EpsF